MKPQLITAALLSSGFAVNAQTVPPAAAASVPTAESKKAFEEALEKLKKSAPPTSSLSSDRWQLKANKAGGEASIKVEAPKPSGADGTRQDYFVFSAPLSKTDDNTRLGTLDGLSDGANAGYIKTFKGPGLLGTEFGMYALAAKLGYRQFTYYDANTLAKQQSSATPVELSASLGVQPAFFDGRNVMLVGTVALARGYEAGKPGVRCPAGTSGPLICINGAVGAPTRQITRVVGAEVRYLGEHFSTSVRGSYDQATKKKEAYAQLYLLGSGTAAKPAPLNAGLDFRRVTGEKLSIGVFVGSDFDLYK